MYPETNPPTRSTRRIPSGKPSSTVIISPGVPSSFRLRQILLHRFPLTRPPAHIALDNHTNTTDKEQGSAALDESSRMSADPRRIPQPEHQTHGHDTDYYRHAKPGCWRLISINVKLYSGDWRKTSRIVLTFHQVLVIREIAIRAHLIVLQTRIHIVPEHAADARAEDGLELRFGVASQFVAVVDVVPVVHDFVGLGGRDISFGREEEVQEFAHFGCGGGVCGQLQGGTFGGWCVEWELFIVVQRQRFAIFHRGAGVGRHAGTFCLVELGGYYRGVGWKRFMKWKQRFSFRRGAGVVEHLAFFRVVESMKDCG
jgi:hypothetical protein